VRVYREWRRRTSWRGPLEDAKGLVWKIALLEGELVEECWALKLAEENSYGLSDAAANAESR
jgi:hypothetical protein